jgi:hypothetical protein
VHSFGPVLSSSIPHSARTAESEQGVRLMAPS